MPTPAPSIYGFVAENLPYVKCALALTTAPLSSGVMFTLAGLVEPTVAGYARYEATRLVDLFDDIHTVPGRMIRLVSKMLRLHNASGSNVDVTGVALVVWPDLSTPLVMAVVPSPKSWQSGKSIAGRLRLSALIHDEGN